MGMVGRCQLMVTAHESPAATETTQQGFTCCLAGGNETYPLFFQDAGCQALCMEFANVDRHCSNLWKTDICTILPVFSKMFIFGVLKPM